MPQHRLEHYFVPAKPPFVPSGRSFIDLPYSIRKLVYKYAELDNILVDLNYANLKVYPEGTYPETQGCRKLTAQDGPYELKKLDVAESEDVWEIDCGSEDIPSYWRSVWGIPYGLHQSMLLVSRQIHEEVEAFTCAGSVFRVCLGQPLGFTRLHRLSDNALSNLGSLTIRLDIPKTVVYFNGWAESPTPLEYIDLSTRWGQIVLKSWKLAIDRLIQSVRPGQLRLHVIFYAMTEADASALIEPMMRLPLLKDCGIRADIYGQDHWRKSYSDDFGYSVFTAAFCETLYHYPRPTNVDTALSRHVQKAIQKLTFVRDVDPAPFRYLDLPQELRFAILEFTDLVSPNAVQWRPLWIDFPHCPYRKRRTSNEGEYLSHRHRLSNQHKRDHFKYYPCCQNCSPKDYSGTCYCLYSGPLWSSSCKCCSRHPLFFASSQIRKDAIAVYYNCNQIVVKPYQSLVSWHVECCQIDWHVEGIGSLPKIELSLYLSSIARSALGHIRWLEWMLPVLNEKYLFPGTSGWHDYLDTLLLIQNGMNISGLTFTINIATPVHSDILYYTPSYLRIPDQNLCRWYETIILPMRRLGEAGLKDFFVHLTWYNTDKRVRVSQEQDLERIVMGKGYNSAERGKPVERIYELCEKLKNSKPLESCYNHLSYINMLLCKEY